MDQLALSFTPPGKGHNQPPEAIDPIEGLSLRLAETHADLLARFRDLELACARMSDPIETEEDAATATDFIARCQLHIKRAETAHKREKDLFLRGGRAVDAIFKGHCERLNAALAPAIARLKTYRDRVAAEQQGHEGAQLNTAGEAARAAAEAKRHRPEAERVASEGQSYEEHRRAEALRLSEEAWARAVAGYQLATASLPRTQVRGNYGATAFVRRSWTFEVVDLDQVPREYMSLDVPVVREAIAQGRIRHIPGLRIFRTEGLRVRATTRPRRHEAPSEGEQPHQTGNSADAARHQSSDQRSSAPQTPKRRGYASSASDPLVASIKPIWGDQRVLRYYRQALASLQPHNAAAIAEFRAANAAIEARLRRKLPQRMEELDFLYGAHAGRLKQGGPNE